MEIKIYTPEFRNEWDNFVRDSKNGTFLFFRDFIEYHGNRFNDYSLLFFEKGKLIAIMPGHIEDQVFYSHKGLTYGGLIMDAKTKAKDVLSIFEYLTVTFRHQGIKKIIYKAVPHIYHQQPAEEDLYALFRYNAILTERNISSSIYLPERPKYAELRKRGIKKAEKNKLKIETSDDFDSFWNILSTNLQTKYNKLPVHSLEEITCLRDKFPENIHLFTVKNAKNNMIAGSVVFETKTVAHIQYIATSDEGKELSATDLLVDHIINAYPYKRYFDYGISTEDNGLYLNENLIQQKESFGARGTVYDTYTINL